MLERSDTLIPHSAFQNHLVSYVGELEGMGTEQLILLDGGIDLSSCRAPVSRCLEVGPVIGEHGVDLIRERTGQPVQEVGGCASGGSLMQRRLGRELRDRRHSRHQAFASPIGRTAGPTVCPISASSCPTGSSYPPKAMPTSRQRPT